VGGSYEKSRDRSPTILQQNGRTFILNTFLNAYYNHIFSHLYSYLIKYSLTFTVQYAIIVKVATKQAVAKREESVLFFRCSLQKSLKWEGLV
jgi:hypothetical protein